MKNNLYLLQDIHTLIHDKYTYIHNILYINMKLE